MKDHEHLPVIPIRRGTGVWLENFDDNHHIDAISSWWVNLFGHANPRINAALHEQLDTLGHVLLAGFSHETVIRLSERLVALTPPGLNRCFYADNGSSAVEVSLKMSFHYWRNLGHTQKTRFITLLRAACDKHNVHLIADEIAVGFGRTGTMFACEQAGITPDFMCLSKGLTGGYMPLSVVLTTDAVYQAFYDEYQNLTAFLHSHSYTGNPLACRAALATLDIFGQDNVLELAQAMRTTTARFAA